MLCWFGKFVSWFGTVCTKNIARIAWQRKDIGMAERNIEKCLKKPNPNMGRACV